MGLRPPGVRLRAKNPARIVLGFNHKNAVLGDNNMVDLGGATIGGERDVMQNFVVVFIQAKSQRGANDSFAQPSLKVW